MNFAIVRLLAVAAVAAAAAWGWQANRYETAIAQIQRDHAIERQTAVDTVVTALQAALAKHRQLTDQLDALDRTHFSEMQRATAENTRLQRALAAGDVRMSVRARCQPDAGAGAGEDQPGAAWAMEPPADVSYLETMRRILSISSQERSGMRRN
ncbi:hypothetical protein FUT88_02445 [Ralstonia sp. TCR112]|uniref:lysis system i-spanin subunit Rz n=1 Tax=Ralstonia sp. TCR112 TaxID=2601730 RepID=UPI0011BD7C51|nr:lysis system i-spanin subunit Rz [Ralstonia sp. TCR112]TXD63522.1 hypothetical protein FUT88_02445 [Ralstonia sp. TCR112]